MSAHPQFSTSDDLDFPYRAISRAAIASVLFALAGAIGFFPGLEVVLVLGILGIVAGFVALSTIKRFPNEYGGRELAMLGLVGSLVVFGGGIAMHTYIYFTEVPDGYERVDFAKLQQTNENLPDRPTPYSVEVDGKDVFIKGYVHPSSGGGILKRFILVPDLGTCCFGGQPRSSDMIDVNTHGDVAVTGGWGKKKLAGQFTLNKSPGAMKGFDNQIFYELSVDIAK